MRRFVQQRGGTVVEAAVCLPILFLIAMAIVEFGRAYNISQALTNAAREGARYSVAPLSGSSTLPSTSDVTSVVQGVLTANAIHDGSVSVNQTVPRTVNGVSLIYTQVDVSAPYQFLFFPKGTITLQAHAVMRNETN